MTIERLSCHDKYGQPTVSARLQSRCSIVKLSLERLRTSVRTDTSATGGNAHEIAVDARLLAELKPEPNVGDRLTVQGVQLRVVEKFVRNDVEGLPHHWQLDCAIWA